MSNVTVPDRWVRFASAAGLSAVFGLAIVVEAVAIAESWGAKFWVFGGSAAVVVCLLALLLRGRRPAVAAVAGLTVAALAILVARATGLPAEPGPALALGLAVLIGSAVRALPPVPAGAVASAGLAVVVGGAAAGPPLSSGAKAVVAMNGAAWLAAVVTGLSLRLLDVRARATVEKVRQDERLELARELHDVVAHHITGMLIQAQAALLVARRDPGKVTDCLTGIESAASDALAAMRRAVGLLRDADDAAPATPGPEQLSTLVERFNRQSGRDGPKARLCLPDGYPDAGGADAGGADTSGAGGAESLPPEVAGTVYRVVREALTNVARHAPQAGSVAITVEREPHGVSVEVVDDAPPAAARPRQRGGYGLIGMRERVETLGGTLSAGPGPGGAGWCVRARLPATGGSPAPGEDLR